MTSRGEQTLGYAILGMFSLFALPQSWGSCSRRSGTRRAATFGSFDGLRFGGLRAHGRRATWLL